MPRSIKDTYTGRSGQMAVMAELLHRECNVAVPEVDVGEDVLAFKVTDAVITRIQVKTANARRMRAEEGYTAQFSVPLEQLQHPDAPPLYYIFATRLEGKWADFILLDRTRLYRLHLRSGLGVVNNGAIKFTLAFRSGDVRSGGLGMQRYRNAWETLPPFTPASTIEEGEEE